MRDAALNFPDSLNNGLNENENRTLLTTSDINEARRLVRRGLDTSFGMSQLVS